jgi:ketosteroid isomerase-like protein
MVLCLYVAPAANAATAEEEVLQVAVNWAKAFNDRNFELISSIHLHSPAISKFTPAKDGAFLAEGWEAIGAGWKGIETIEGSLSVSLHNPRVIMLGDSAGIITGYIIITETDAVALSRITLVVQKINGKWLIVHEHSSKFPVE